MKYLKTHAEFINEAKSFISITHLFTEWYANYKSIYESPIKILGFTDTDKIDISKVKQRFAILAKQAHPDVSKQKDHTYFTALKMAYDLLRHEDIIEFFNNQSKSNRNVLKEKLLQKLFIKESIAYFCKHPHRFFIDFHNALGVLKKALNLKNRESRIKITIEHPSNRFSIVDGYNELGFSSTTQTLSDNFIKDSVPELKEAALKSVTLYLKYVFKIDMKSLYFYVDVVFSIKDIVKYFDKSEIKVEYENLEKTLINHLESVFDTNNINYSSNSTKTIKDNVVITFEINKKRIVKRKLSKQSNEKEADAKAKKAKNDIVNLI